VGFLRRRDRLRYVRFTDIAGANFNPAETGRSLDVLMNRIHGRLPDGRMLEGVEVFRHLYAALGWIRLVSISRWPGIAQVLDLAYAVFARNRLRLTGRCDTRASGISPERTRV
jgi:predicted DCC family thiol-disulfide oxidoreductase YuxK